jgi:hypothetical protein
MVGPANHNAMAGTMLLGVCLLPLVGSEALAQSTCTVDRLTDGGAGQELRGDLRYCMALAQSGVADTIEFEVTGTIRLTGFFLSVPSVAIVGPGSGLLTVQQTAQDRIFDVRSDASAYISGLTVTGGQAVGGGGGIANSGSLTLDHCLVSHNSTRFGNRGGGILNVSGADLTIEYSTISDNSVGPAIGALGGGIYNEGNLTVFSSTIFGNILQSYDEFGFAAGGGIYSYSSAMAVVVNSTVSGNGAFAGPGSENGGGIAGSNLFIRNSTITGNVARHGAGITGSPDIRNTIVAGNGTEDLLGTPVASGYNVFGTGQPFEDTDIIGDPLLGLLTDNGGPTFTHALLDGSPAIDAGDNTDAPDFDQRGDGFARIVNGIIDIGAYEVQGPGSADEALRIL